MTILYTFSPPVMPDFGMKREYKPKVLKAEFGDGYSQRTGDGQNNMPLSIPVSWTNLSFSEMSSIVNFFIARRGFQSFYFTYVDEGAAKVYICESWDYSHSDAADYTVNATLMQVYDV